jgi:hypothetical protein
VRAVVALQVSGGRADAGLVFLEDAHRGIERDVPVDERGGHGGQNRPRGRAGVAGILAARDILEDGGHLAHQLGVGRRETLGSHLQVLLGRQLKDQLMPDHGVEVVGREGGGHGGVRLGPRLGSDSVEGRQARLPLGADGFFGVEEALVVGTLPDRRKIRIQLLLTDGNAVDSGRIRRYRKRRRRKPAGQNNEENQDSLHAPRMLQAARSGLGVIRRE